MRRNLNRRLQARSTRDEWSPGLLVLRGVLPIILARCRACHSDSGIQSVQSRLQWMKSSRSTGSQMTHDTREDPIVWEIDVTIAQKRQEVDFKLLQSLWRAQ
jgi:hypothetical protein